MLALKSQELGIWLSQICSFMMSSYVYVFLAMHIMSFLLQLCPDLRGAFCFHVTAHYRSTGDLLCHGQHANIMQSDWAAALMPPCILKEFSCFVNIIFLTLCSASFVHLQCMEIMSLHAITVFYYSSITSSAYAYTMLITCLEADV